jgi:hypothetical protein
MNVETEQNIAMHDHRETDGDGGGVGAYVKRITYKKSIMGK